MSTRTYRTFQALIFGALGIFLLARILEGKILLYINQRFVFLVLAGALGFMLIAQVLLASRPGVEAHDHEHDHDHNHDHDHDHGKRSGAGLWLVALPLLIGLLVPARPLSTAAVDVRGMNADAPLSVRNGEGSAVLDIPSTQWSVLDWIRAFNYSEDLSAFEGKEVDVTGFVYHDIRLMEQQFMVGRFSLTCCVADATALGMVVNWPEASNLADNGWVRVRGVVRAAQLEGKWVPHVDAETVEIVPEPEQPYLFP
ncbi:MAG: TIGR03943 family protein [Anaerolineae bacterium]|nr:TIGR03943 family protein [Anaerolineae bacterium]